MLINYPHSHQIHQRRLEKFLTEMEAGYTKYKNPYHNNLHAADVTQTVHYILYHLGFAVIYFSCFYFSFAFCSLLCKFIVHKSPVASLASAFFIPSLETLTERVVFFIFFFFITLSYYQVHTHTHTLTTNTIDLVTTVYSSSHFLSVSLRVTLMTKNDLQMHSTDSCLHCYFD